MASTRISVALLLALDVPLTWEDAVAVAQEAAMLSDVNAAMNSQPSLVSAEACFITRTGDLELPETTKVESPDAVATLLREMLAGREAPAALEALAFGPTTRDMSGALQQFPIPNRRARIAKLAVRALVPAPVTHTAAAALPDRRLSQVGANPDAGGGAQRAGAQPAEAPPADVADPHAVASAEFRHLQLKSAKAAARRQSASAAASFLRSRRGRQVVGGGLAASALAALVWTAINARETPGVLEATDVLLLQPTIAFQAAVHATPAGAAQEAARKTRAAPALGGRPGASAAMVPLSAVVPTPRPPVVATLPTARGPGLGIASASGTRVVPTSSGRPVATADGTSPSAPTPPVQLNGPRPGPAPVPANTNLVAAAGGESAARAASERAITKVFSDEDPDVSPPSLLRQQLPNLVLEPGSPVPSDWPYLVLIVDTKGAVESVRLNARLPAPGESIYRHSMLVAAAKAWQFSPARKDGRPVRYEVRVPLEP